MENMSELIIDSIKKSIEQAEIKTSKLTKEILDLDGMSSPKIRHFLNNLMSNYPYEKNYLEIGTWKGSTFISALYGNSFNTIIGIDNFSEFDLEKKVYNELKLNLKNNIGETVPYNFIASDYKKVDLSKYPKFNLYLYDGDHKEEEHYDSIKNLYPHLTDEFVLMVDDWLWEHVKNGTMRSIQDLGLEIVYSVELPSYRDGDVEEWWNGYFVAYLRKTK